MSRKKRITLDELAAELGLTKHTVSKALRGLPGMSEDTRRAVTELAAAKGYLTKEQKKELTGQRDPRSTDGRVYRLLFVVVSDTGQENQTHHSLFQGVSERAAALGHSVTMVFLPGSVQTEAQFAQWAELSYVRQADGLFLTPNTPVFLEQCLLGLRMPRVMLNFAPPDAQVDHVIWDVYEAALTAVRRLLAYGHRSIMYIGDIQATRGNQLRWQAFCAGMQEAGLSTDPQSHLLEGDQELDKLSEHFLERYRKLRPTSIVSSSYSDLKWIYYATSSLGLQIPDDCSLVTLSTAPLFTDISRPVFLMKESGSRGVDQMVWRIAHPDAPYERVSLASYFHEGATLSRVSAEAPLS